MKSNLEPDIPIACSLSVKDLADREGAWRRLLGTYLLSRERVAGGLRLTVRPDAVQQLNELVALERKCCPWITFVTDAGSVTMTAAGPGQEIVVKMFGSDCPEAAAVEELHRHD